MLDHAVSPGENSFPPNVRPGAKASGAYRLSGSTTHGQTYQKTQLENGIQVITETMPEVRSISLGIIVRAGPYDETPARCGLGHVVEHMLFQGTASRDAHQIACLMDLAGGQIGGFTARDYTCFHATVLDEHCPYALDLLGDLLLNSVFPPDRLEAEKLSLIHI